jgi:hypothetical protein
MKSCELVTHDRMTFIVRDGHYDRWLRVGMKDTVLNCAEDTPLNWYPVSHEMNKDRNELPELMRVIYCSDNRNNSPSCPPPILSVTTIAFRNEFFRCVGNCLRLKGRGISRHHDRQG